MRQFSFPVSNRVFCMSKDCCFASMNTELSRGLPWSCHCCQMRDTDLFADGELMNEPRWPSGVTNAHVSIYVRGRAACWKEVMSIMSFKHVRFPFSRVSLPTRKGKGAITRIYAGSPQSSITMVYLSFRQCTVTLNNSFFFQF